MGKIPKIRKIILGNSLVESLNSETKFYQLEKVASVLAIFSTKKVLNRSKLEQIISSFIILYKIKIIYNIYYIFNVL